MLELEKIRHETPGVNSHLHFNNAGSALPPKVVTQAILDYITYESLNGGYEAADARAKEISEFYEVAGQLIGATSKNMAFTSSATNSFARALSSIPFERGDHILIANEDYISNQLAFLSLQKRLGIKLLRAKSVATGGVDIDDMTRLMDIHKPKLVSLTHVPTNTGMIQPVEEIGKRCKERNINYLVDACQSTGQIPVNVNEIHCDFLCTTMRKFLRGPRGTGFLYVSDSALAKGFEPLFIDMRGADWKSADQYEPRADAKRFEDWELPYALVAGSSAAIQYALQIGIENIATRNKTLCLEVIHALHELGLNVLDKGPHQSSIITVEIPDKKPEETLQFLRSRNINTSISSVSSAQIDFAQKGIEWALRISPHYYNTEEEVATLVAILAEFTSHK